MSGAPLRAGVLFDLDGTLAQTEHLHHAAFNAVLANHGRTLDHAAFVRHVSGRSNEDITAYFFPGMDEAGRVRVLARTVERRAALPMLSPDRRRRLGSAQAPRPRP